jgi:hypothetical protein
LNSAVLGFDWDALAVVVIQHRAGAASFNGFLGSGVWFGHLILLVSAAA